MQLICRGRSTLESVAVEGAAQLAGAGEVAGVKAKRRREHTLLQVEVEVGREQGQQRERRGVVHFADDPFAAPEEIERKRVEDIEFGAFAIDLDQIHAR